MWKPTNKPSTPLTLCRIPPVAPQLISSEGFKAEWKSQSFQIGTEGIEYAMEPGPLNAVKICCHITIDDEELPTPAEAQTTNSGKKRKKNGKGVGVGIA